LSAPPTNGIEALGLHFLGTCVDMHTLVMLPPDHPDTLWDAQREALRDEFIRPREDAQDRLILDRIDMNAAAPESAAYGVTLAGQVPDAIGRSSVRAVSARVPDLAKLTNKARRPLDAGRPKAGSTSGHLLYTLTKVNDMCLAGRRIDPASALLGQMLLMLHGGAHTIHEMLSTIQLVRARLKGLVDLPPMRDASAGLVPSYRDLLDLLGNTTSGAESVREAARQATRGELGLRPVASFR
jgi:hypothetical protein